MSFNDWEPEILEIANSEQKPIILSIGQINSELIKAPKIEEYVCIHIPNGQCPEVEALYLGLAEAITGTKSSSSMTLLLAPNQHPLAVIGNDPLADLSQAHPEIEIEFVEEEYGTEIPLCVIDPILEFVDPLFGGLARNVKEPMGYVYSALVKAFPDDPRSWFFAKRSLHSIMKGSICDPLTGGVSRSAGEGWKNPTSEVRLCDQALLLEASAVLDLEEYTATLGQFILDHLTSEDGTFYSSLTGSREFGYDEINDPLVAEYYGLPLHEKAFLSQNESIEEFADKHELELGDMRRQILLVKNRLQPNYSVDKRVNPFWNALAIRALYLAGERLMIDSFKKSATLAFSHSKPIRFNDYAAHVSAALVLGEVEEATRLCAFMVGAFKSDAGPFYMVDETMPILMRQAELICTTLPSGNSIHAENLLTLYELTRENHYLEQAEGILRAAHDLVEADPIHGINYLPSCQKHAALRG